MVHNLTYSTSIFESLGLISGISVTEMIWEKYKKFAIPKINDSTVKLRGLLFYLKDFTPKDASIELGALEILMPVLSKLRVSLEPIDKKEFQDFKIAALEFFDTVDLLYFSLQDISDIHSSFELSKPVLASDWDSSEDNHWDTY